MPHVTESSQSSSRAIGGIAKLLLSAGIVIALAVCAGVLYLAYLAAIPPCSDPGVAWYNCPPDPARVAGLALVGLVVLALASLALVRIWIPGRWHGWSWPMRIFRSRANRRCLLRFAKRPGTRSPRPP